MRKSIGFVREFVRQRKVIGACLPSGGRLARAMVRGLGDIQPGQVIIELGPGTGVFTKQLHEAWPDNKLIAVEFTPAFAEKLQHEFPNVEIVNGCASQLLRHLAERDIPLQSVAGIVSGLPLLSLPPELRDGIFDAIRAVLPHGQRYVQFTYSKKSWKKFMPAGLRMEKTRRVWRNVPPATVLPFVREVA